MNLDELYFKDSFTKEENKINLEVNKLTLECLESKNKTFKLDELGNLRVKSISTIAPTPDIVTQTGAIYLSSNKTNPGEYLGGIWKQKRTSALFDKKDLDQEQKEIIGANHMTFNASENNAIVYNIEGKCEQKNDPSPNNPSEIRTIKGIRNLFNKEEVENGYLNVANGEIILNNDWITTNFIPLENNTENVTIIGNSGNKEGYCFYDNEKAYLIGGSMASNVNKIISVPNNAKYFKATVSKDVVNQYAIYLNHSINTHYVPYGSWLKSKVTGKNLFDLKTYFEYSIAIGCTKTLINNGIQLDFTNGADAYLNFATNSTGTNELKTSEKLRKSCIEVRANQEYTISLSSSPKCYISFLDKNYEPTAEYVRIPQTYSKTSYTLTTNENTKYIMLRLGIQDSNYTTYSFNDIQLEEGTEATEYEPYKEKEILMDMSKDNLLNTPYTFENKLTNTATRDDFFAATDYYAELKAGKIYTFKCKTDGVFGKDGSDTLECYLLKDKKYEYIIRLGTNPFSFTVASDGKFYLRYDINQNGRTHSFWDFEIYEGYSPYYELYSTKDLSIRDRIEVVSGVLEKRIGKIVLDGTQPISGFDTSSENTIRISFNNVLLQKANIEEGIKSVLCNRLSCVSMWAKDTEGIYLTATHIIIRINKSTIGTTTNEINTYLSNHPLEIYYVLEEPEEIQLTPTDVPLFEDENHVTLLEDVETSTEIKYKPYLTVYVWERVA